MLFRMIISKDDIRRFSVEDLPDTVEEFVDILRRELDLDSAFIVQFEDPAFQNELCNLTNISDLPEGRATLKIIQKNSSETSVDRPPSSVDSQCSDSLLVTASGCAASSDSSTHRTQAWPHPFVIPKFAPDVEMRLKNGNEAYHRDGTLLDMSKDIKSNILDKLAEAMYTFKSHPTNDEYTSVAQALIEKYPCVRDPGSSCGWYGWKYSLRFKMGNFLQKLRLAGCLEVSVNSKKRPGQGEKKSMKKPKKSELNFLPDLPQGKSPESLEEERSTLVREMKKRHRDWKQVDMLMDSTFSLRRKEVIEDEPLVENIKSRWPALFTERQIVAEFRRIMSLDLKNAFFHGLEEYVPKFLRLYRARESSDKLQGLVQSLESDNSNQQRRAAILVGLPHFLNEEPSDFYRICEPTDEIAETVNGMKVGILVVTEGSPASLLPKEIVEVAVVLEQQVVLHDVEDVSHAFALLMGLLYALNIGYPKELKHTFEVIQRVIMNIGGDACSARVHGLRNRLLRKTL